MTYKEKPLSDLDTKPRDQAIMLPLVPVQLSSAEIERLFHASRGHHANQPGATPKLERGDFAC